jgi:hypothetical protein
MATGRSDYPNQINNVCAFPYIFRGNLPPPSPPSPPPLDDPFSSHPKEGVLHFSSSALGSFFPRCMSPPGPRLSNHGFQPPGPTFQIPIWS